MLKLLFVLFLLEDWDVLPWTQAGIVRCPDGTYSQKPCNRETGCADNYFCHVQYDPTDSGFCCQNTPPPGAVQQWGGAQCPDGKYSHVACNKMVACSKNTFCFVNYNPTDSGICCDKSSPTGQCPSHPGC